MTKQEILEDNKLISKFMGWSFHPKLKDCSINKNKDRVLPFWVNYNIEIPNDEFRYHSSWDWLMPVVEKIESIYDDFHGYFGVYISSNSYCIQGTKLNLKTKHYAYMVDTVAQNKLEAVYISVIEFIKWYNINKK